MKTLLNVCTLFLLAAFALTHADLRAGEKKDKDKDQKDGEVVVNDLLNNADPKDKVRTQCFCKTFVFKMTEGKSYQLDMISTDFDSYLRLEDPKGQQVAADDDSGGFPNARIIYQAPKTGDYTIVCTTFGANSTGKFTLKVKQTN